MVTDVMDDVEHKDVDLSMLVDYTATRGQRKHLKTYSGGPWIPTCRYKKA